MSDKAWAIVDAKTNLIRMEDYSTALAIFDTRAGARRVSKLHKGTIVKPVKLAPWKDPAPQERDG